MPDNLFSETKMIAVLTDVQIVEGALNYNRLKRKGANSFKEPYYNQVFLEHNITAKDLRQNLNYYNSQPELMEKIIDKVLENLNQLQGQVEKEIADQKIADSLKIIEYRIDSLRIADSLWLADSLRVADSLWLADSLSANH
jgi:transcription termination factor NusB